MPARWTQKEGSKRLSSAISASNALYLVSSSLSRPRPGSPRRASPRSTPRKASDRPLPEDPTKIEPLCAYGIVRGFQDKQSTSSSLSDMPRPSSLSRLLLHTSIHRALLDNTESSDSTSVPYLNERWRILIVGRARLMLRWLMCRDDACGAPTNESRAMVRSRHGRPKTRNAPQEVSCHSMVDA